MQENQYLLEVSYLSLLYRDTHMTSRIDLSQLILNGIFALYISDGFKKILFWHFSKHDSHY